MFYLVLLEYNLLHGCVYIYIYIIVYLFEIVQHGKGRQSGLIGLKNTTKLAKQAC